MKFNINGLDLVQDADGFGYIVQGLSNPFTKKYSVSDILQRHGVVLGKSRFGGKTFSFTVFINGRDPADHADKRLLLEKYLTPSYYADSDKIAIVVTLDNGSILTLDAMITGNSNDLSSNDIMSSAIQYNCQAEYPFFVSQQKYQQIITIGKGGTFAIPFALPLDMSSGSAVTTDFFVGGNVWAFPKFTFSGKLTTPTLVDVINQKSMTVNATINSGASRIIDIYNESVLDNAGNNKMSELGGDFLILPCGQNSFILSTGDVADTGIVTAEYQYHYVSI